MNKLLLAMSVCAFYSAGAVASEWGYEGSHGPAHWGGVSETCAKGQNQSPVDIEGAVPANLSALNVSYQGQVTALTNNGHTLQATIEGNNQLQVDGKTFTLKQFHFHTPSENLIKAHQYPLEAHFVNADEQGNLAVVAVMFDMGSENTSLQQLTESLPDKGHTVGLAHPFAVDTLLPETTHYYRFNGSLTTPPCSEGVRWFVMQQPKALSEQQQAVLMGMMGKNNRPIQPRNARIFVSN